MIKSLEISKHDYVQGSLASVSSRVDKHGGFSVFLSVCGAVLTRGLVYVCFLLQFSIKQELKLSGPAGHVKKDKKGARELMVCPKKKKRKQCSPAKVRLNRKNGTLGSDLCRSLA